MYLVRHLTSGEFFLCNNVSEKRGWVTMVEPRVFKKFDSGLSSMGTFSLPIKGKLSLKIKDTKVTEFLLPPEFKAPRRKELKYIPPEAPPKKWWQRWL